MKKRALERALEAVPDFDEPDPAREQYRTPAPVAADLLWLAFGDGEIQGRDVLDLGCGTGIFSLGAHLLGAGTVTGVDLDAGALAHARTMVPTATFIEADLEHWHPEPADTVLMNPPFGAQRRGADRVFYDRAAEALRDRSGAAWFLAQPKTQRFLLAYASDLGAELEQVGSWDYPLPARFGFHEKEVEKIQVAGYRLGF